MEPPEEYTLKLPTGQKLSKSRDYTGTAKALYTNGDVYDGHFVEGVRHGKGIYKYANGDVFTGIYEENRRNGLGRIDYAQGGNFYGNFSQGKRSGALKSHTE